MSKGFLEIGAGRRMGKCRVVGGVREDRLSAKADAHRAQSSRPFSTLS